MPVLAELKTLCDSETFVTIPPTWSIVNFLLLKHVGLAELHLGAVVAASGEAAVFSYNPHDFAPMYFGTIGGSERLAAATGYRNVGVRTEDAEEAFAFIKATIDGGKGLAMAGPEMGICYGYEDLGAAADRGDPTGRRTFGVANWGPGFGGTDTWAQFEEYIGHWGRTEGVFTVKKVSEPGEPEAVVAMIAEQAVAWNEDHPATAFGRKQTEYGLRAFRSFVDDVSDPEVRSTIESPYVNCHALLFQHSGRHWLGTYLREIAGRMPGSRRALTAEVGTLYLKVASELRRFQEFNILENRTQDEISEALTWLEAAFQAESQAVCKLAALRARAL